MKKILKLSIIVICFLSISACSIISAPKQGDKIFILPKSNCSKVFLKNNKKSKIIVEPFELNSNIDERKIIYSRDLLQRGYYQYAHWFSPISIMLKENLINEFECQQISIAPNYQTNYDYLLNIQILDFVHDISVEPGIVFIEYKAELVSNKQSKSIKSQKFQMKVPVEAYNSEGAVKSFNSGTNTINFLIAEWVKQNMK